MDQSSAARVVDDVFLDLWRRAEELQEKDGPVRSWLMAQAYKTAAEEFVSAPLRRRCRPRSAGASVVAHHSSGLDAITPDPASQVLLSLPAEERDVVGLALFPGHTYRDVAMLLGQDEALVRDRMRLGLSRVRETGST